jgi:hypothetical protein
MEGLGMMTRHAGASVAALLTVLLAIPAHGQTCLGRPSFGDGWFQVVARGVFTSGDTRSFRGGFSSHLVQPVFAGLSYTRSNSRSFANVLSGQVGADLAGSRVAVCPLVEVSTIGGGDDTVYATNGLSFEAGGHVGIVVADTDNLRLVPTIGIRLYYEDLDYDFFSTTRNPDVRVTGTAGLIQAGLGVVFSRRIAVTPMVRFNVTSDDAISPWYLVSLALNFGG